MNLTIGKQLTIVILLITVSSIHPMTTLPIGNTTLWWLIYAVSVFVIVKAIRISRVFSNPERKNLLFIQLLLLWYLVCIIRGIFIAENYWEWKNLVGTSFAMMLPLVAYLAINPAFVSFITRKWLLFALPLFFLFLPFLVGDGTGRYLVPISILLLFFSILTNKWKLILVGFSLFIFLGSLDARSNVIKFGVPLLMGMGIYFNFYKLKRLTGFLYYLMLFLPMLLFWLGVTGVFNVFKLDEFFGEQVVVENGQAVSLTADTRTGLYEEVLFSAVKNNYYIWGNTPARGNESELFSGQLESVAGLNSTERISNEVSILNIFTWTGLIGVVLYFLAFARGAFLAIFQSKNQFARLLGLYVLFRWCYAWVEDFNNFDLSYLYLWIVIGLCYSSQFRAMSDLQVKYWIRGIFDFKYRNAINLYNTYLRRGKVEHSDKGGPNTICLKVTTPGLE